MFSLNRLLKIAEKTLALLSIENLIKTSFFYRAMSEKVLITGGGYNWKVLTGAWLDKGFGVTCLDNFY